MCQKIGKGPPLNLDKIQKKAFFLRRTSLRRDVPFTSISHRFEPAGYIKVYGGVSIQQGKAGDRKTCQ